MWGRGLGIIFALLFSNFLRKGCITLGLGLRLSTLFTLGAGQGFIGWWIVKNGLEEPPSEYVQPRVIPYCLAAHLTSTFVIYSGLFWTGFSVVMPEPPVELVAWVRRAAKMKKLALPISFTVAITAILGVFVAGNDVVTLGISTLLSYVPVSLGSAHQARALTLLTLMILLNHTVRKPSMSLLKSLPQITKTI